MPQKRITIDPKDTQKMRSAIQSKSKMMNRDYIGLKFWASVDYGVLRLKAITDAAYGFDVPVPHLFSQIADVDIDNIGAGVIIVAPDVFE